MKFLLIAVAVIFAANISQAEEGWRKCAKMVYGKGVLKKYQYMTNTLTENTNNLGSSNAMTEVGKESTTARFDTGVSTGQTHSTGQFSSSKEDCSATTYFTMHENRTNYISQNMEEIKKEISLGRGGHLEALSYFSQCDSSVNNDFAASLQKSFVKFVNLSEKDKEIFSANIDEVIKADSNLSESCIVL